MQVLDPLQHIVFEAIHCWLMLGELITDLIESCSKMVVSPPGYKYTVKFTYALTVRYRISKNVLKCGGWWWQERKTSVPLSQEKKPKIKNLK